LISQSNSYATAPTLRDTEAGKLPQEQQRETSMTALTLENIKLIILLLLVGSVIGLSHLSGENLTKNETRIRRPTLARNRAKAV
jgi:hypothetical protein